ncbi:MAG: hypothetical protein PHX77_01555 [Candidatus Bipolaricaulis sp.]|nr:hypothetical protein [Candidatus Bipolaricaulis sp.]MDD5647179.1 hypothetical protein [Candidatus Bipolaricaulis sp.]
MKRRTWVLGLALVLFSAGTALGASTSVSWSSWIQLELQPLALGAFDSALTVGYSIGSCTASATALIDDGGVWNLFADVGGALGGFAVRSIADFDATVPALRAWLSSVSTAIAGVRLYGLLMVDDVYAGQDTDPWYGIGGTFGVIWEGSGLSIWGQAQFNMTDSLRYVYLYGLDWLMDHFVFDACGSWYKPSTYVDIQTGGCALHWSGLTVYVEFPICCADLLAAVRLSCAGGLEYVLVEMLNVDLGLAWINVEWVDLWYTVESKSANAVFGVSFADSLCITPYLALTGGGTFIDGIDLKALLFTCTWNGYTFTAGHLFDEDGWQEYLNGTYYDYGWTWGGELTYLAPCKVPTGYDEFFGVEVEGDVCCGGDYGLSAFAWFDTGESAGIFDWVETRVLLRAAVAPHVDLRLGVSATVSGSDWVGFGVDLYW